MTWVALIRGVGAASHKVMSMNDLTSAASAAGFANARTLLATGNLLFESDRSEVDIKEGLDEIVRSFTLTLPVILRRADALATVRDANPFPNAAAERPSKLLVAFMESPVSALPEPPGRERLAAVGSEVFVDYPDGIGTSKLAPGTLDRKLGVTGTTRNWNTLLKLIKASTT